MFGALARATLPEELGIDPATLAIVSIMPCTAKKFEAKRPEFAPAGRPDVDYVITTQELVRMIEESGIRFSALRPESFDLPLGFKTGAGVIFGNSGGVTEAVLRYVSEELGESRWTGLDFQAVRGHGGLREAAFALAGREVRVAVVHGLAQARKMAEEALAGRSPYQLIEVMACPGGCIGGAGQPVAPDSETRRRRTEGLYAADKMLQLHRAQDNPYVRKCYQTTLGEVGGEKAHRLLHTHYQSRRRIAGDGLPLVAGRDGRVVNVHVCVGTSCFVRGSQNLLHALLRHIRDAGLQDAVDVKATFCFERCDRGPTVRVGEVVLERCTLEQACAVLSEQLSVPAEKGG